MMINGEGTEEWWKIGKDEEEFCLGTAAFGI